jgi:hypothetical protein
MTPRAAGQWILAAVLLVAVSACGTAPDASPTPSATTSPTAAPTPAPTLPPTPTPAPTPRFTNVPDADLDALLPATAAGVPVVVPPREEYALTPGDVGLAYGEIGLRFSSLAIAYTEEPRSTLYAVRVDGEPVTTEELEPHLATAGRYVGIAGLHRDPWELTEVSGRRVWVRGEDAATAAGTRIYTWASGEYVFLLIGVSDAVNAALIGALPGEEPPPAAPEPSGSAGPSGP